METGATHDREDPRVQCHRCLTFRHYDPITRGAHPCIPTQGWKILEDRVAELERENSVLRGEHDMNFERYLDLSNTLNAIADPDDYETCGVKTADLCQRLASDCIVRNHL